MSMRAERWLSKSGKNLDRDRRGVSGCKVHLLELERTHCMRNLLTIFPSTPVTKGGAISKGKDATAGAFDEDGAEDNACGASNAIFATGSPSRISSVGNRRDISLPLH